MTPDEAKTFLDTHGAAVRFALYEAQDSLVNSTLVEVPEAIDRAAKALRKLQERDDDS